MTEPASLQHTAPVTPIAGEWCAIAYPALANRDALPRLVDAVPIDIFPAPGAVALNSALNVEHVIAGAGGSAVHGWNLTQFYSSREKGHLIEAAPHAVWRSPEGKLADITPTATSAVQGCFIPAEKLWKTFPNSLFFVPAKAMPATLAELRQILAAKYVVKRFVQKQGLIPGTPAEIQPAEIQPFSRKLVRDLDADAVFQFVLYELSRQRLLKNPNGQTIPIISPRQSS